MAGPIKIAILADASQARREIDGATSHLGSGLKKFGKIAAVGIGAAATAIGGLAVVGLKSAADYQKITARTQNVLKTTHHSAQVTAKQVTNLANRIEDYSSTSDEAVQSGENLLLTFTQIRNQAGKGNDIFNQTTKAAVDLSTAMGTDVPAAALQLGKALNDPTKGFSRLQRTGVSFTTAQTDMIKKLQASGDLLGAQKIILGEVRKEFGGAARAAGTTFAGSMTRLKGKMGDLLRDALTPLLPKLTDLVSIVEKKVLPKLEKFAHQMENGRGAGGRFDDKLAKIRDTAKEMWPQIKQVAEWTGKFLDYIASHKKVLEAFVASMLALKGLQTVGKFTGGLSIPKTIAKSVTGGVQKVFVTNPGFGKGGGGLIGDAEKGIPVLGGLSAGAAAAWALAGAGVGFAAAKGYAASHTNALLDGPFGWNTLVDKIGTGALHIGPRAQEAQKSLESTATKADALNQKLAKSSQAMDLVGHSADRAFNGTASKAVENTTAKLQAINGVKGEQAFDLIGNSASKNTALAGRQIDIMTGKIKAIPSRDVKLSANVSDALRNVANLHYQIDQLHDKTIIVRATGGHVPGEPTGASGDSSGGATRGGNTFHVNIQAAPKERISETVPRALSILDLTYGLR